MVQNTSWKNDENIFHQKCQKQYCLLTESVSGDVCGGISPKTYRYDFSCVFMFSAYCRVSYSKCMLGAIALQKRVSFVRARSRK